jgi:7-carboxy-7-deazaguanine synthase
MFGKNPIRKPRIHDGSSLEVKQIFPTLQGEGPYTGWPALFIRLGGCNLACDFCDTEFEDYQGRLLHDILHEVKALAKAKIKLAVITGGEPLRQNIVPLCEALIAEGFKVQIESNGTLYQPLPQQIEIICSPKNTGQGYFRVRDDLRPYIRAFKFIISDSNPLYHDTGEVGQTEWNIPVYVQPMDEYDENKNKANQKRALSLAMTRGYLLSLQTHKILGIE